MFIWSWLDFVEALAQVGLAGLGACLVGFILYGKDFFKDQL